MHTKWIGWLLVAMLVFAIGCDSSTDAADEAEPGQEQGEEGEQGEPEQPAEEASALEVKAQELAALAAAIEAEPERTDELLSEAGMTEAELEEAIFDIAEDPAASAAFRAAR
jgi:hypothetical protein